MNIFVQQYFRKTVPIQALVVFRLAFGFMMLFSTVRFILLGWIDDHYLKPVFHFHYYGFEWVHVLSPWAMYSIHALMVLGALGIFLGAYYRLSAILFFVTFTYCELIDLTYYLNHYYFVSIVSFLIIFLPLHQSFSFDVAVRGIKECLVVPAFMRDGVMLQMGLVYFFAGIAKINHDWLMEALPLKIWLPAHYDLPLIGLIFKHAITAYVFSWAGMLYDISIPFLLLISITRPWAYASVIFFHGITGMLFQIGIFPLVMMSGTIMFFSNDFHVKIINRLNRIIRYLNFTKKAKVKEQSMLQAYRYSIWTKALFYVLILHMTIQLFMPLRYLCYPGNLYWNEEGYRYSWRVMLMEKAGTATFFVKDSKTGREGVADNALFLNAHQEKQMAMQPDMVLQFAHFLAKYYAEQGVYQPQVRAEVYVTLNGRPSKLIIDPTRDLAQEHQSIKHQSWILPY